VIYYLKNHKWTAISNSNSRYWEIKEFGDCKKVELNVPQMPTFGWIKTPLGYKRKEFTSQEFQIHLKDQRRLYELMMTRIDRVLEEIKDAQH